MPCEMRWSGWRTGRSSLVPSPWVALSARADVTLVRSRIAEPGRYYHRYRTIVLRAGLLLAEERRYLWHELVHADRGDTACDTNWRVEAVVEREAVRRALPLTALTSVFEYATSHEEAVEQLKVPDDWIQFRLDGLTVTERTAVRAASFRSEGAV